MPSCFGMLHSLLLSLQANLAHPTAQGKISYVCKLPSLMAGCNKLLCTLGCCVCIQTSNLQHGKGKVQQTTDIQQHTQRAGQLWIVSVKARFSNHVVVSVLNTTPFI